jgi:AcrR family transcriptional regulator
MSGRSAAMQRTREAILDAAVELFEPAWFDEVTLADVAAAAGVSQQTVVNHFGSKLGLYLAGISERVAPRISTLRGDAAPGDVDSIVAAVVRDYEESGDGTHRTVVLSLRIAELEPVIEAGRRAHREWVEEVFAPQLKGLRGVRRERAVVLLASVLDVSMWHRLRRVEGLDAASTEAHLRVLVEGVLATVAA